MLPRHATQVGAGDHIVLWGRLRGMAHEATTSEATTNEVTTTPGDECIDAIAETFVAQLDLSADVGVARVKRDPIAEELGVAGSAGRVTAEGSYVVFAGDSNRTEMVVQLQDGGWQTTVVEGADAADAAFEAPAVTAQALPLSDGRTLVVRPPSAQGRRLRLESLDGAGPRATTLWPPAPDAEHVEVEADLLGDVAHLRVFQGNAAERILMFGGAGNPIWFSTTKGGFAGGASMSVARWGVAWQASSIVPLPRFQGAHGYPAGTLLVIGGLTNDATLADLTESQLQLFDPKGNRWLSPSVPLPWPMLHASPVLLPDGNIALIGGRFAPGGGRDIAETRVIYLHPDAVPAAGPGVDAPAAESVVQFSMTVGRAPMSRARGVGMAALLLPSGGVFIGGGQIFDGDASTENANFEILEPPYLTEGRPRPLIQRAPDTLTFGSRFVVEVEPTSTSSEPATVVLMAYGSVTFGRNVPQRHLELVVESVSPDGRQMVVQGPDTPLAAPPGRYLLFVVDGARVPSRGVPVALGGTGGDAP